MTDVSHHSDITVVCTTQHYFSQKRSGNTQIKNFSDYVLFVSRNDRSTLRTLNTQWFMGHPQLLNGIANWISKYLIEQHAKYMVIGKSNQIKLNIKFIKYNFLYIGNGSFNHIPESMLLRTNIFPQEESNKIEPIFFVLHDLNK